MKQQHAPNRFMVGLKVLAPVILTFATLWFIYDFVHTKLGNALSLFGFKTRDLYIDGIAIIVIVAFFYIVGWVATSRGGKNLNKWIDWFFMSIYGVNFFYGIYNQFFSFDEKDKGWIPISLSCYYSNVGNLTAYVTSLEAIWDFHPETYELTECYPVNITISGGAFGGHTVNIPCEIVKAIFARQDDMKAMGIDPWTFTEAYSYNISFGKKVPTRFLVKNNPDLKKKYELLKQQKETKD
jgi:hypothetical protein